MNRMAVSHWIEHQPRPEHQEIRAQRTRLAGRCRSAPDNGSSPPPIRNPTTSAEPSTRSIHPTVCTDVSRVACPRMRGTVTRRVCALRDHQVR